MEQRQLIDLLNDMSLEEKAGQLFQVTGDWFDGMETLEQTGPEADQEKLQPSGRFCAGGLWSSQYKKDSKRIYGTAAAPYSPAFYAGYYQWV